MIFDLSDQMEAPDSPWQVSRVDPAYVEKLLPAIAGFVVEVENVEIQLRLSQQNGPEDRRRVKAALAGGSLRQRQVADAMTRYLKTDEVSSPT